VPLQWITDSAVPLLVAQAVIVAAGAVPAFLLGRRWLGDDRLAVAGALMWLLYAPIQWAVVTDLHAVTLAAPLLMLAIWAAEVRNDWVLAIAAALALMGKEQVGLAVAILGIWIIVRQRRWIAGAVLSAASLAWTLIAVLVIIPASGTDLPRRSSRPSGGGRGCPICWPCSCPCCSCRCSHLCSRRLRCPT